MDCSKYSSEGKNQLLSDEIALTIDGLGRSGDKVMGWEIKPFPHTENYTLLSSTEALESLELMELGFTDMIRKPYSSDPSRDGLSDGIGADSNENLESANRTTSNLVCGEKEFRIRTSSNFMESNIQDLPAIDLKLGWLADSRAVKDNEFSEESKAEPSVVSSSPAKRARSTSLYSNNPYCQVYGCNKDLSSSKDYHKRHKVCDIHSKTAKVIVNGIEQRFCQQCSRFHLLAEFDDGKRSCRKRLAHHNERRRKPQIATQSGARLLDPSLLKRTSFLFPDVLPGSILSPAKDDPREWISKHVKFEDRTVISNPFLKLHGAGERTVSVSARARDNMVGNVTPSIQDVSSAPNSSCALSLLSTQSQNMSRDILGTAIASSPLITNSSEPDYISSQSLGCFLQTAIASAHITKSSLADYNSGESLGCSLGSLENFASSVLNSPEMKSKEVDKMGSTTVISCNSRGVNFKVPGSGTLTASDFVNPAYSASSSHSAMVNLLQLSSHLEKVEQQRNSIQPMLEDSGFCRYPLTHGQ